MSVLPLSFMHHSVNIPDAGGSTPLSGDEVDSLAYAAWLQHLDAVVKEAEVQRAAVQAKRDAALAEQDAREGAALTVVLNRLGFAVADLPCNLYRAPDGILFSLSAYAEGESAYNAIGAQPVEKQEPDHFYLRVMFTHDPHGEDEDVIYASRILGGYRRLTGEQIVAIQAAIPAAIDGVKAEVQAAIEARARRIAAAIHKPEEAAPVPQSRFEVFTLDQSWPQGETDRMEAEDGDLADMLNDGWAVISLRIFFVEGYINRIVSLARQIAVAAVQS